MRLSTIIVGDAVSHAECEYDQVNPGPGPFVFDKWNKADEAGIAGDDFAGNEFRDFFEIAACFLFSSLNFDLHARRGVGGIQVFVEEARHEDSPCAPVNGDFRTRETRSSWCAMPMNSPALHPFRFQVGFGIAGGAGQLAFLL